MAFDFTLQGTSGNDNLQFVNFGENSILVQTLAGNDVVVINSDLSDTEINLDGGSDNLLVTSTSTVNPTIRQSTIGGGNGSDVIRIETRNSVDNIILGGGGGDFITLTNVTPGANFARYTRTTVLGDGGSGDGPEGVDKVFIDGNVGSFNASRVNLNGNGSGIIGNAENALIDSLAKGSPLDLLALNLEGMLVQANEISESTFQGGAGSDWLVFTPGGIIPPASVNGIDRSLITGNADTDSIVVLRNTTDSTVSGGTGADYVTSANVANEGSIFKGGANADVLNIAGVQSERASYFGGQGDDNITIASGRSLNTLVFGGADDDNINFFGVESSATTLSGGDGDDTIDDYASALITFGNVLDGGAGDDVITQAANVLLPGIGDFGATFIGGTGADVMTGENSGQPALPKEAIPSAGLNPFEIQGAASDLFSFSFGDSAINAQGVGHDQITDFDSNSSFYLDSTILPLGPDFTNPLDYTIKADGLGLANSANELTILERDVIDLTNANIRAGVSVTLPNGGGPVAVNSRGLVLSGVDNITEFVQAGSLQTTAGAALVWTQFPNPFPNPVPFPGTEFRTSWLFISDGDGVLTDQDLLIELTNVSFVDQATGTLTNNGGLIITNGEITNLVSA